MYAVLINNDNTVSTLVNQTIYEGYKLSDWFWLFTNPYYENKSISNCDVSIQFTLPVSKKIITEKINLKDESYEGYLKYSLISKSKITNESGIVIAKLIFTDSGNIIRETSYFEVPISVGLSNSNNSSIGGNDSDNNGNNSGGNTSNCNCNNEGHLKEILNMTKPLVFSSVNDAITKLNSGTLDNIYYGQIVSINENGKYISYTVQQNGSEYTVEPIDTVAECKGVVWKES